MRTRHGERLILATLAVALFAAHVAFTALAQDAAPAAGPSAADELALNQSRIADKYAKLEQLMLKMAELEGLTAAAVPRVKFDPDRAAQQALVAYNRRLLDLGAALQQETMDRERTRALLADILGPVVLRRDAEGDWAEMEEPAQRLALAGSTLLTMVARARFEIATFGL